MWAGRNEVGEYVCVTATADFVCLWYWFCTPFEIGAVTPCPAVVYANAWPACTYCIRVVCMYLVVCTCACMVNACVCMCMCVCARARMHAVCMHEPAQSSYAWSRPLPGRYQSTRAGAEALAFRRTSRQCSNLRRSRSAPESSQSQPVNSSHVVGFEHVSLWTRISERREDYWKEETWGGRYGRTPGVLSRC